MSSDGSKIADSRAAVRAAEKMVSFQGSIRGAWESLNLGWSFDDLMDYFERFGAREIPEELRGRVLGLVAGVGLLAVEQDRDREPELDPDVEEPGVFVVERTEEGVIAPFGGDRMWGTLNGRRYCVLISHDQVRGVGGAESRWHISVSDQAHLGRGHEVPLWRDFVSIVHQLRPGVPFVIGIPPRNTWMNKNPNVLHAQETRDAALIEEWRINAAAVAGTDAAVPS